VGACDEEQVGDGLAGMDGVMSVDVIATGHSESCLVTCEYVEDLIIILRGLKQHTHLMGDRDTVLAASVPSGGSLEHAAEDLAGGARDTRLLSR